MRKLGTELRTRISIVGFSCGDTVEIEGEVYVICGYHQGEARYVKGKTGQVYRIVTVASKNKETLETNN